MWDESPLLERNAIREAGWDRSDAFFGLYAALNRRLARIARERRQRIAATAREVAALTTAA